MSNVTRKAEKRNEPIQLDEKDRDALETLYHRWVERRTELEKLRSQTKAAEAATELAEQEVATTLRGHLRRMGRPANWTYDIETGTVKPPELSTVAPAGLKF